MGAVLFYVFAAVAIAGIAYGAYMLAKGSGDMDDMEASTMDDFNITTADEGSAVPLIYGTRKVTGNLIFFDNLQHEEITQEVDGLFSSDDVVVGFNYFMDVWLTLGHGPLEIVDIYMDDEPLSSGSSFWDFCDYYYISEGKSNEHPQIPWDVAPEMGRLEGVAWVFMKKFAFGENATTLPTVHWIVRSVLDNATSNRTVGTELSCNPSAAVFDILMRGGASSGDIDLSSFNSCASYWKDKGYGINIVFRRRIKTRDAIKKILAPIGGSFAQDNNGKYYLIAFDEDDSSQATLDFDSGDIKDFSIQRPTWDALYSDFIGTYIDQDQTYSKRTVKAYNPAVRRITGKKSEKSIDLTAFVTITTASKRIWEIMKENTYPAAQVICQAPMKYSTLLVGSVVTVINTRFGIGSAEFRLLKKSVPKQTENYVKLELRQKTESLYDSNWSTAGGSSYQIPDWTPDTLASQGVFQIPYNSDLPSPNNYNYLVLAQRRNAYEQGFAIYYSLDGGSTWIRERLSQGWSQKGNVVGTYPVTKAIDEDEGITINLYDDVCSFSSVDMENALQLGRFLLCGDEMMGFGTVTANQDGTYTLTDVIRGVWNSPIEEHSNNSVCWLVPNRPDILFSVAQGSFRMRLLPYSIRGMVDLSDATEINNSSSLVSGYSKPLPPICYVTQVDDTYTVDVFIHSVSGKGAGQRGENNFVDYERLGAGTLVYRFHSSLPWKTTTLSRFTDTATIAENFQCYHEYNGIRTEVMPYMSSIPDDGSHRWSSNTPSGTRGMKKLPHGFENYVQFMEYSFNEIKDNFNVASLYDVDDSAVLDNDYLMFNNSSQQFETVTEAEMNVLVTTTTTTTSTTTTTTITVPITTTTSITVTTSTADPSATTTAPPDDYTNVLLKWSDVYPEVGVMEYSERGDDGNRFTSMFYPGRDYYLTKDGAREWVDYPDNEGFGYNRSLGYGSLTSQTAYGIKVSFWRTYLYPSVSFGDGASQPIYIEGVKHITNRKARLYTSNTGSEWTKTDIWYSNFYQDDWYWEHPLYEGSRRTVDYDWPIDPTTNVREIYTSVKGVIYTCDPDYAEKMKEDGAEWLDDGWVYWNTIHDVSGDFYFYFDEPITAKYFKLLDRSVAFSRCKPSGVSLLTDSSDREPVCRWIDYMGSWNWPGYLSLGKGARIKDYTSIDGDGADPYFPQFQESSTRALRGVAIRSADTGGRSQWELVGGPKSSGKWYVEFKISKLRSTDNTAFPNNSFRLLFGMAQEHAWVSNYYEPFADRAHHCGHPTKRDELSRRIDNPVQIEGNPFTVGYENTGTYHHFTNGSTSATLGSFNRGGDIIQLAFDATNERLWFGKNNVWDGDPAADTGYTFSSWKISGTYSPYYSSATYTYQDDYFLPFVYWYNDRYETDCSFRVELYGDSWRLNYTPPTGFSPWGRDIV